MRQTPKKDRVGIRTCQVGRTLPTRCGCISAVINHIYGLI